MPGWIDAHNHLQDPRLGTAAPLLAAMSRAGIRRCLVNATREADWPDVAALAHDHPSQVLPAFGIHPWQAHTATPGWQDRLIRMLETHPLASLGECGLDRWVSAPSINIQWPVFLAQLRIAREMARPLTIHCLKAWGPLFDAFQIEPPPARFLLHSFGGSIETARRLIPLGAYFSFSGYFLQPRKADILQVFRQIPKDRILVETDAPDMTPPEEWITHPLPDRLNHPANLPAIGNGLATGLGLSAPALADLTAENFDRCFGR